MDEAKTGRIDLLAEGLGREMLQKIEAESGRPGLAKKLEPALKAGLGQLDLPRRRLFRDDFGLFDLLFGRNEDTK